MLTPCRRHITAISAISLAICSWVVFLLDTSLQPPCMITLFGGLSAKLSRSCFTVVPGIGHSLAYPFFIYVLKFFMFILCNFRHTGFYDESFVSIFNGVTIFPFPGTVVLRCFLSHAGLSLFCILLVTRYYYCCCWHVSPASLRR